MPQHLFLDLDIGYLGYLGLFVLEAILLYSLLICIHFFVQVLCQQKVFSRKNEIVQTFSNSFLVIKNLLVIHMTTDSNR